MEQTNVTEQDQSIDTSADVTTDTTSQAAPAPVEKTFQRSEVDNMIRHSNANVAKKAREQAVAEYKQQQVSMQPQTQQQDSGNNIQDMVAKAVEQRMQNEKDSYMQKQREQKACDMSNQFNDRMSATKDNYEDFDTVTQEFPFSQFPNAVISSMAFDNTGDIMYELASDPIKMQQIEELGRRDAEAAQRGQTTSLAAMQMRKISQALKVNQSAKTAKTANAPLSHIQSSPTGTDNGNNSVSDYRRMFKKNRR